MDAETDALEAEELALAAVRAIAAGGHEALAAEMLRRAARAADRAAKTRRATAPAATVEGDYVDLDLVLDGLMAVAS